MRLLIPFTAAFAAAVLLPAAASAHCDSLDGPVVKAARTALASGDANLVMPWVKAQDEPAIRQAFARTLKVRKLSPEASGLADTWFFETLVRIHRAGEGAPYDGLKPAGGDLGPAISGADRAVEAGNVEPLAKMLASAASEGLQHRFHRVLETKKYEPSDVQAGREYVAAYVDFIHFAERLHQAMSAGGEHAAEHQH